MMKINHLMNSSSVPNKQSLDAFEETVVNSIILRLPDWTVKRRLQKHHKKHLIIIKIRVSLTRM